MLDARNYTITYAELEDRKIPEPTAMADGRKLKSNIVQLIAYQNWGLEHWKLLNSRSAGARRTRWSFINIIFTGSDASYQLVDQYVICIIQWAMPNNLSIIVNTSTFACHRNIFAQSERTRRPDAYNSPATAQTALDPIENESYTFLPTHSKLHNNI